MCPVRVYAIWDERLSDFFITILSICVKMEKLCEANTETIIIKIHVKTDLIFEYASRVLGSFKRFVNAMPGPTFHGASLESTLFAII